MFSLEFSNQIRKFIKKLDKSLAERIIKRIENLKNNPVPSDAKFICRKNNLKIFRYRIGDYRVLYSVNEDKKLILLIKLDKRSRIYD